MIKYLCDRCGKKITLAERYTIPPSNKNENGIRHHGGFVICNECYHRWNEVKERVSDVDFVEMSDEELQPYRCDFKVDDEVITNDGRVGKIVNICTCNRCRERGFFEPTVELNDGSTDYIMISDWKNGFRSYYKIGNHIFGNLNEEAVNKEIDDTYKRYKEFIEQLTMIKFLKNKKENSDD